MFQVIKKQVKLCDIQGWGKTNVLFLDYKINWEKGNIQVKDYDDKYYAYVLKQLKQKANNLYIQEKMKA